MMKRLLFAGVILVLGLLQVTLVDSFKIFNVKPDLLLMIALLTSFVFDFKEALVLSVFAGLLKDVLGPGIFGMNALLFALWTFLIERVDRQVPIDHDAIRVILVFTITLLHHTLRGLFSLWAGRQIRPGIFLRIIFLEAIYTTLIFPWVFKGVQWCFMIYEQNKERSSLS